MVRLARRGLAVRGNAPFTRHVAYRHEMRAMSVIFPLTARVTSRLADQIHRSTARGDHLAGAFCLVLGRVGRPGLPCGLWLKYPRLKQPTTGGNDLYGRVCGRAAVRSTPSPIFTQIPAFEERAIISSDSTMLSQPLQSSGSMIFYGTSLT